MAGIEQAKREGQAAIDLMGNAGFQRALALAREKIHNRWVAAQTVDEREALHRDWHALDHVMTQLEVVEGRGHMAQAELDRHAKPATPAP